MDDLHNNIKVVSALGPVAMTTSAGLAGKVLDRKGYGGVEFVVSYGAVTATNATIAIVVKEGDVTGTMVLVPETSPPLTTMAMVALVAVTAP